MAIPVSWAKFHERPVVWTEQGDIPKISVILKSEKIREKCNNLNLSVLFLFIYSYSDLLFCLSVLSNILAVSCTLVP